MKVAGLRCRLHGGGSDSGRPPTHGLYSTRLKVTRQARDRIEEIRSGDELFDAGWDIAIASVAREAVEVPDPDDKNTEAVRQDLASWHVEAAARLVQMKIKGAASATFRDHMIQRVRPHMDEFARRCVHAAEAALPVEARAEFTRLLAADMKRIREMTESAIVQEMDDGG